VAGELAAIEADLLTLRRAALFASVAGPALAQLAERSTRRRVDGELFRAGDAGSDMFVVASGALVATRETAAARRVERGGVVGELSVLTHAPRATTVAADGTAELLAIDREAFTAAARRAPEVVLGLAATLAGWLAPNRPDVL
jgi:CRP-like cAMP-binding protein